MLAKSLIFIIKLQIHYRVLCFHFVISQIKWIKISTETSNKSIPNIHQIVHNIPSEEFIYQALWKYSFRIWYVRYIYQWAKLFMWKAAVNAVALLSTVWNVAIEKKGIWWAGCSPQAI